ncbi:MAG TPA: peptidylprolyl isomerase [Candidatus Nanopelagicales bacterium]
MTKPKKPGTGASNKRRKELAAAKYERQLARRQERASRRRRKQVIGATIAAVLGVLAIAGVVLWTSTSGDDVASPATSATPDPAASTTPNASTSPEASASATADTTPVDIGCDPMPTPPATPPSYDAIPADALQAGTEYQLGLATNCGEITIATLADQAPKTVNAMLGLAADGYFDGTPCHRLTTSGIFVLQCGDPTGTGSGGPGFELPDENLPEAGQDNYPKGTVAMANAGPGTSGSQFFIVYQDTTLPPNYTIWGTVTTGMDVVEQVAKAGVAGGGGDGAPAASVGIVSTSVTPPLG